MSKLTLNELKEDEISPEELAVYRALRPYIGYCLNMNHELNNPLAGIIGYAEFLLEDSSNLTTDQQGYLRQVLHSAERIRCIIDELCEKKIVLADRIDLQQITEAFTQLSEKLD